MAKVNPLNGIKIGDVVIGSDVLGCLLASLNEDGSFKNLQIVTPEGHKLNLEPGDNLAIKPASKVQWDTAHRAEGTQDEFEMSTICDKKTNVEGVKWELAGLKFMTADADESNGWDKNIFKLLFKKTKELWTKLNLKAGSIDIRAHSTGPGTGGGIAVQIAGVDSDRHCNKFKIETDQIADVDAAQSEEIHNGEGGKGIEIGTINPLFTSLYTSTYRFRGDSPIYGVTRGDLETVDGKTDYPTQPDDSKDIIDDEDPVTWNDMISCVKAWKASQGL